MEVFNGSDYQGSQKATCFYSHLKPYLEAVSFSGISCGFPNALENVSLHSRNMSVYKSASLGALPFFICWKMFSFTSFVPVVNQHLNPVQPGLKRPVSLCQGATSPVTPGQPRMIPAQSFHSCSSVCSTSGQSV